MARSYKRDKNGRFSGGGGGGGGGKASAKGGRWQNVTNEKGQVVGVRDASKGPRWKPVTNKAGQVVGMSDANKRVGNSKVRETMRMKRAVANSNAAHKQLINGNDVKAARKGAVARRATDIYLGKVDPKAKTKARLTGSRAKFRK